MLDIGQVNLLCSTEYQKGFEAGKKTALQWQPIESAPKDGTEILASDDGKVLAIVRFISYGSSQGRFEVYHDYEQYAWNDYYPTHWMHLPPAPEVSE